MFKIYEGETVVVEGESPLTITGLDPDTNVAEGTYQVVRFFVAIYRRVYISDYRVTNVDPSVDGATITLE